MLAIMYPDNLLQTFQFVSECEFLEPESLEISLRLQGIPCLKFFFCKKEELRRD